MMKFKHEIFFAKLIASILIILTVFEISASGASRQSIANFFMRHNHNLSHEQAQSFTDIAYRAGAKYHVSPSLIASIIICESNADPRAVSRTKDYGLMQIHYQAHKDKISKLDDLFDPEINIFTGTRIFAQCRSKSHSLIGALTRYSGGSKSYAQKVIKTLRNLEGRK